MKNPIKHLLVLMLENNSFDHVLGYVPGVGTLTGSTFSNTYPGASKPIVFQPGVVMAMGTNPDGSAALVPVSTNQGHPIPDPDPEHTSGDVLNQIYGKSADPSQEATNAGFVENYIKHFPGNDPQWPMSAYDPKDGQLPALHALAAQFTVLRQWYSSLPGATGANRLFALCATSGGYYGSDWPFEDVEGGIPMPSILGAFPDASSWKVYCDGSHEPGGIGGHVFTWPALSDIGSPTPATSTDLITDLRNGTLPSFGWIVPSYETNGTCTDLQAKPGSNPGAKYGPTSMLPGDGCPMSGDAFVGMIYNALRSSPRWDDTALLIVFDEHGGLADSSPPRHKVVPPNDVISNRPRQKPPLPPWLANPTVPGSFDFTTVGVRVPAILVSRWAPTKCDDTLYEHASIPRTVRDTIALTAGPDPSGYLTARDAAAQNFLTPNLGTTANDSLASVTIWAPPPAQGG